MYREKEASLILQILFAKVIAGNVVITNWSCRGHAKVGQRYVGESIRTSFVKSSSEPQISVVKNKIRYR